MKLLKLVFNVLFASHLISSPISWSADRVSCDLTALLSGDIKTREIRDELAGLLLNYEDHLSRGEYGMASRLKEQLESTMKKLQDQLSGLVGKVIDSETLRAVIATHARSIQSEEISDELELAERKKKVQKSESSTLWHFKRIDGDSFHDTGISQSALSRDGSTLFFGAGNGNVDVVSTQETSLSRKHLDVSSIHQKKFITTMDIDHRRNRLFTGDSEGRISVTYLSPAPQYKTESVITDLSQIIAKSLPGDLGSYSMTISKDNNTLYFLQGDSSVAMIQLDKSTLKAVTIGVLPFPNEGGKVYKILAIPNSNSLIAFRRDDFGLFTLKNGLFELEYWSEPNTNHKLRLGQLPYNVSTNTFGDKFAISGNMGRNYLLERVNMQFKLKTITKPDSTIGHITVASLFVDDHTLILVGNKGVALLDLRNLLLKPFKIINFVDNFQFDSTNTASFDHKLKHLYVGGWNHKAGVYNLTEPLEDYWRRNSTAEEEQP